jgi:hypothetical protein
VEAAASAENCPCMRPVLCARCWARLVLATLGWNGGEEEGASWACRDVGMAKWARRWAAQMGSGVGLGCGLVAGPRRGEEEMGHGGEG